MTADNFSILKQMFTKKRSTNAPVTPPSHAPKPAPKPASKDPILQVFPVNDHHTATTPVGIYAVDMNMKHRPAVRLVLEGREHEPHVVNFINNRCGTGDVVQAGAFFGDMLPGISSRLAEGSIVWSFEPNPRSHYLATKTIGLNNLKNVTLTNAGLGASKDRLKLVVQGGNGDELGGLSHIVGAGNTNSSTHGRMVEVDIVTIDDVIPLERHVSIIQLDVEGYELTALQGARKTIERCRPILILEFVSEGSALSKLFPNLNYTPVGLLDRRNTVFCPICD